MKFHEGDIVRTLVDKDGFPKGSEGLVVYVYLGGPACEVEVWDKTDYPIDVVFYYFNELELVERYEQ